MARKDKLSQEEVINRLKSFEPSYNFSKFKYEGASKKSIVICDKNHQYLVRYSDFYEGKRCPMCNTKGKSGEEFEIIEYINTFYKGLIINGDRTLFSSPYTGHKMEIDIHLVDIKFGIEFNSIEGHRDSDIKRNTKGFKSADEYHNFKTNECNKLGIELIHIDGREYKNDKNKILEYIKNKINNKIKG